jgi:hypothetical protein
MFLRVIIKLLLLIWSSPLSLLLLEIKRLLFSSFITLSNSTYSIALIVLTSIIAILTTSYSYSSLRIIFIIIYLTIILIILVIKGVSRDS